MHSDSVVNKSIAVIKGYDFAATAKNNMIGLRRYAKGNVASRGLGEGVYFSTRTQDGQSRLGKFTRGQEAAVLGGNVAWEIHESKADINRFIDAMTPDQLKVIDKKLTQVSRLTKDKLKKLVASGQVKLNASMYIAENCSNLSFMITVTDNMPKRENNHGGNDRGGNDGNDGDDVSSTPGERGG